MRVINCYELETFLEDAVFNSIALTMADKSDCAPLILPSLGERDTAHYVTSADFSVRIRPDVQIQLIQPFKTGYGGLADKKTFWLA